MHTCVKTMNKSGIDNYITINISNIVFEFCVTVATKWFGKPQSRKLGLPGSIPNSLRDNVDPHSISIDNTSLPV